MINEKKKKGIRSQKKKKEYVVRGEAQVEEIKNGGG